VQQAAKAEPALRNCEAGWPFQLAAKLMILIGSLLNRKEITRCGLQVRRNHVKMRALIEPVAIQLRILMAVVGGQHC
jgi:hypothetical protein